MTIFYFCVFVNFSQNKFQKRIFMSSCDAKTTKQNRKKKREEKNSSSSSLIEVMSEVQQNEQSHHSVMPKARADLAGSPLHAETTSRRKLRQWRDACRAPSSGSDSGGIWGLRLSQETPFHVASWGGLAHVCDLHTQPCTRSARLDLVTQKPQTDPDRSLCMGPLAWSPQRTTP